MGKRSKLTRKNFHDEQLWKSVMARFLFSKRHRDGMVATWRDAEDHIYGQHWKNSKLPKYKSKVVDNSVFEAIETTLPVATGASPKAEVYPRPSSHHTPDVITAAEEYAKGLTKEIDETWVKNRMNRKLRENWRNYKGYGTGVMKSIKIPGQQDIDVALKDVYQLFPDPFAANLRECEKTFFCEVAVAYCDDVKKIFGVEVKPEGEIDEYRSFQFKDQESESGDGDNIPIHDTAGEREDILTTITAGGQTIEGQCLLVECWYADQTPVYETVTVGDNEERTSDKPIGYGDSDKYPFGRHTIIAHGEKDLVLLDEPNPYKHFPYFGMKNYSESSSFWGRPEYKQVDKIVKASNMIISQLVDNIRLTANPKWLKLRQAKIKEDPTNEPGTGHETNMLDGLSWITPPSLNVGEVVTVLGYLNDRKDNVLGVQDPGRGKARPGDSGKKVEILRSQSEGRVQPAIDDMTEMLVELVEHWVYIIQNMYDQEKVHRIRNESGEYGYKQFLGVALQTPQPGQTFEEIGQIVAAADIDFDVKLSVGDYLQHDKQAEFEELAAITQWLIKGAPAEFLEMMIDAAPNIRDKGKLKDAVKQLAGGDQDMPPELQDALGSDDPDVVMQALLQNPNADPRIAQIIQKYAAGA